MLSRQRFGLLVTLIVCAIVLATPVARAQQQSDDQVWSGFLAYLKQAPPLNGPGEALQGFEKALVANGVTREEATRQFGIVRRLISVRADWWPLMFDRIYTSDRPNFSQNPSTVLVEAIEVDIDPATLKASLAGFDIVRFDDREAVSEWDPQPTRLCRVIARKR